MPNDYHAETVLLEGADAQRFAHAQFSSPVDSLAIGHWQFSAWLSPQGRVRAFFHLIRLDADRYMILLRGGDAATLSIALQRFIFRSRVRVTAQPARTLSTGPSIPLFTAEQTDVVVSLGCDDYSLRISTSGVADDAWRRRQLIAGWTWLAPTALDELLPAALSLQRLGAVAVDKGCYPGQEIVARLHFRGGSKRHLHLAVLSQDAGIGTSLQKEGREVGRVLDVVNIKHTSDALLALNDDIAEQLQAGTSSSFDNGLSVTLVASWPA